MLYNRVLGHCSLLGPGGVESHIVSKSKDVLVSLVLESVLIHIDGSVGLGDSCIEQFLLRQ